jgi:hypothetical protein
VVLALPEANNRQYQRRRLLGIVQHNLVCGLCRRASPSHDPVVGFRSNGGKSPGEISKRIRWPEAKPPLRFSRSTGLRHQCSMDAHWMGQLLAARVTSRRVV